MSEADEDESGLGGGLADPPEFPSRSTPPVEGDAGTEGADDGDPPAEPDPGAPFEVGVEGDQGEWHEDAVKATADDTDSEESEEHV